MSDENTHRRTNSLRSGHVAKLVDMHICQEDSIFIENNRKHASFTEEIHVFPNDIVC